MTTWTDNFIGHPIHNLINDIDTNISQIEFAASEPGLIERISRLRHIHELIKKIINNVDPEIAPPFLLSSIHDYLNKEVSFINQYNTSKDAIQLSHANDQADHALVEAYRLYFPNVTTELTEFSEILSKFRKNADKHTVDLNQISQNVETRFNQLNLKIEEAISNLQSQENRVQASLDQFQERFSIAEVERTKNNADAERKRDEKFLELISSTREEVATLISNQKESFKQYVADANESYNQYLQEMIRHKAKAEELVFAITNTGMVGGYQKNANKERRSSIVWQVVTVLSIIGMIIFAIYAFYGTLHSEIKVAQVLARFFVTGTIAVLVGFGIRQVIKHDRNERYYRQMELELASIQPYLVGLPENEVHNIKKLLADRYFGQQKFIQDSTSGETSNNSDVITGLFNTMKPLIEDLIKKNTPPN